MIDIVGLVANMIVAIVASLVFFWFARREMNKTAVMVAQMEERFRHKVDDQVRRLEATSLDLSKGAKKQNRDEAKIPTP